MLKSKEYQIMTMKESIHNYELIMKSLLNKLENNNSISYRDKELILRFKDDCFAKGLSTARVVKYVYHLIRLNEWLSKDFEDATKEDIQNLVIKIEKCSYVEYTKIELKICIKKIYRMLKNTEDYPPEVKWIKPGHIKAERIKLPEELLTEEDIVKLINAANSQRDKAFIAMLYETGCRIGEILFIRIKHIQFDQYGALVMVSGKTGSRRLRIITSVPYLTEWLNNHKWKENPDAYLWICRGNRVISYRGIQMMLNRIGGKARVKKRLNPHNFRHSRATYLANHLTEAQMKVYFGWVRASDMAAVYVHLSGRDVDNAILKVHGITNNNDKEESKLNPKNCPRCEKVNQATNKFCSRCGMLLDRETMMKIVEMDIERKEADRILDEMIKDEEFREIFLRKARELVKQS